MSQTEKDLYRPVAHTLPCVLVDLCAPSPPLCAALPPYCPVSYPAFAGKTTFKVNPNVVSGVHKVHSKRGEATSCVVAAVIRVATSGQEGESESESVCERERNDRGREGGFM